MCKAGLQPKNLLKESSGNAPNLGNRMAAVSLTLPMEVVINDIHPSKASSLSVVDRGLNHVGQRRARVDPTSKQQFRLATACYVKPMSSVSHTSPMTLSTRCCRSSLTSLMLSDAHCMATGASRG